MFSEDLWGQPCSPRQPLTLKARKNPEIPFVPPMVCAIHAANVSSEGISREATMKKQLLITSVLAFGMGIAGAQTQAPAPMQGGTAEPGRGTAPQQPISPGAAAQVPGTPINSETAAPQSFKGCLNGSPGRWNLAAY